MTTQKELLAALRAIEARTVTLDDGVESDSPGDTQIAEVWKMATTAIEKATS